MANPTLDLFKQDLFMHSHNFATDITGAPPSGLLQALTAASAALTLSPASFDGSAATTVALNLANANTWTALQTFGSGSAVLVSASAGQLAINGTTASYEQFGTAAASGTMSLGMFNTTAATASEFQFYRSKNAGIGSATAVASGDNLGQITWYGAQQTGTFGTQNPAAQIRVEVDATVTSGSGGDMPGRLLFLTTLDNTGTLTERLRISNAGGWGLSGANFGSSGNYLKSNGNAAPTWAAATISGIALGSNLASLSATNTTLTFSASYNGSSAQTVGLNLANANSWTGLQTFTGGAFNSPFRQTVGSDATESAGNLTNLAGLTVTVSASTKYSGILLIYGNDSRAADGIQFDLNGGGASFTAVEFGFVGTPIGTTLGTSISTSVATPVTATIATTSDTVYMIAFTLNINKGGTVVPRFAQLSHSTGTATVRGLSYIIMEQTN